MRTRLAIVAGLAALLSAPAGSLAQDASQDAPPPKVWTLTASAGYALTSGNSDTSTVNAGYDITYDPQRKNLVKSDALYLRGRSAGALASDRVNINIRDQFRVTTRAYLFGQNTYLRDRFKNIEYLLAPTGGLGFRMIHTQKNDVATLLAIVYKM